MTTFAFIVEGPPQPKQRARACPNGKHVTPARTRRYETLVGEVAGFRRPPDWRLDGTYYVEVRAFFPDRRRRDTDNVAKSVLDALNKILWRDDSQVVRLVSEKHVDGSRPRVEVHVELIIPTESTNPFSAPVRKSERKGLCERRSTR